MKFDPPIEEPLDDSHSLIIPNAWLDSRGLVVAETQVFNGTAIHSDTLRLSQSSSRKRFIRTLVEKVNLGESLIDQALLKIGCNLPSMLTNAPKDDSNEKPTQATRLIELANDVELFHAPDGEAYATVIVSGHKETWLLKTKGFRRWLMRKYYEETKSSASSQALQDALGVLESKAVFDGEEKQIHIRVAEFNGAIYIDLANDRWEAIEITKSGWRVIAEPPVKFRRAKGMLALPAPVEGGSINELRPFLNVNDDDWPLLCGCLVQAYNPRGPYPVIIINGEQGSAKSTASRVIRFLIDPNTAALRSQPREERDLAITANNGWIVALDNLSKLSASLSDSICRIATGGGFATRELYSDTDEILLDVQRLVIINGIEELATRGDMLDRGLLFFLPAIPEEKRISEEEFWSKFEEARPKIIGSLCNAVSKAMNNLSSVQLTQLPRMADFALWATAAEQGLGFRSGTFIKAYTRNRQDANALALEASPVAGELWKLVKAKGQWEGIAKELLGELNSELDDAARQKMERQDIWPKNPRALSNILRRLAPNLRAVGVEITFKKKNRAIHLEQGSNFASPSSPSVSSEASSLENQQFNEEATGDDEVTIDDNLSSPSELEENQQDNLRGDEGNAKKQTHSESASSIFPPEASPPKREELDDYGYRGPVIYAAPDGDFGGKITSYLEKRDGEHWLSFEALDGSNINGAVKLSDLWYPDPVFDAELIEQWKRSRMASTGWPVQETE